MSSSSDRCAVSGNATSTSTATNSDAIATIAIGAGEVAPPVGQAADEDEPGGAAAHGDELEDAGRLAAQTGREQLGTVDAERRNGEPADDAADERPRPHRPSGDREHQDGGDRAAGQTDGADDAAAAHVGQPSAGDDADAGGGAGRAA